MNKQLMEIVLPRLASRLHDQLQRYHSGKLDDDQFARSFESLLQRQYAWLAKRGVSDKRAALALHAAVLILSSPGLAAEAVEQKVPLEVIEARAVRTAAEDIAENYGINVHRAFAIISGIVARYGSK
jgi:hypothetical protein